MNAADILNKKYKLLVQFLAGSHLYGTNTELSDIDTRGVFIADKTCYLGIIGRVEQVEDKKNDTVFHEVKKFLTLAADCNPNIVEYLFVPEDKRIVSTVQWDKIVKNKAAFLSKRARFSFAGYAHAQFKRIKRHRSWLLNPPKKGPERTDYGMSDGKSLLTKEKIGAFNEILIIHMREIAQHHELREALELMDQTRNYESIVSNIQTFPMEQLKTLGIASDNFLEALSREKAYRKALQEWHSYQNWKTGRNPARAELESKFGYDTKHAAHLVRLMSEGEELLTTGHITFPRTDAEFLLSIRRGALTYEELEAKIEHYDAHFEKLYSTSILPHKPDIKTVNELCMELVGEKLTEDKLF